MNLVCLGSASPYIGGKYTGRLRIKPNLLSQDEEARLQEVKHSCWNAYLCNHCGGNCMRGKHVTLNLGTNDILKRELPNYPHQGGRPCRMRWEKALTHLFHKFEASFIREVLICEIPKFQFISPEMSTEERYFFGQVTDSRPSF